MVSGMGQFSVYDIGTGIHTLATNPEVQQQMLKGLGNYLNQLRSCNAKVYGETAFNIASLVVGGVEIKSAECATNLPVCRRRVKVRAIWNG